MRIHHNTVKKAKKFHINLVVEENEIVALDEAGNRLAEGPMGNVVLDQAIDRLNAAAKYTNAVQERGVFNVKATQATREAEASVKPVRVAHRAAPVVEPEFDEETSDEADAVADAGDEEVEEGSRSIVKDKYRKLYQPHESKCGDDLASKLSAHVTRKNADGEVRVSFKALRAFAIANGCWVESYSNLKNRDGGWNAGQARMNVSNRLRAKIRRAKERGEEFEIAWK